jgi:hypothetical protein
MERIDRTVVVRPSTEVVTVPCSCGCGQRFQPRSKKHRFFNGACRVRFLRQPNRDRRNRWTALKYSQSSGFILGHLATPRRPVWLPRLSEFER